MPCRLPDRARQSLQVLPVWFATCVDESARIVSSVLICSGVALCTTPVVTDFAIMSVPLGCMERTSQLVVLATVGIGMPTYPRPYSSLNLQSTRVIHPELSRGMHLHFCASRDGYRYLHGGPREAPWAHYTSSFYRQWFQAACRHRAKRPFPLLNFQICQARP